MDKRTIGWKTGSLYSAMPEAGATKMDKVENLKCLYQGYGILEEEWVTDSECHSVVGSTFSG